MILFKWGGGCRREETLENVGHKTPCIKGQEEGEIGRCKGGSVAANRFLRQQTRNWEQSVKLKMRLEGERPRTSDDDEYDCRAHRGLPSPNHEGLRKRKRKSNKK